MKGYKDMAFEAFEAIEAVAADTLGEAVAEDRWLGEDKFVEGKEDKVEDKSGKASEEA